MQSLLLINVTTERPPPCNFYYLSECKQGTNCHYSHDYFIPPEDLIELRKNAKKWPCPMANKGRFHSPTNNALSQSDCLTGICVFGDDCVMGHVCPRGSKCPFAKQGRCKYTASTFICCFFFQFSRAVN
jgi:hypothetical protein